MPRKPIVRPLLDTIVTRNDGTTVTIADQIVELLRVGTPVELAAAAVGVTPAEYRGWMREGLAGLSRLAAGRSWTRDFTAAEQASTDFADRVQRAIGEWAGRANALLEQLQRGGYETTTTRVKRVGTDVVETMVTTSQLAPDARVLTWRLERGFPSIYGRFATGPDLSSDLADDDSTHDVLMERLSEIGRRMHVIDVTEVDTDA